jgi:hypothetical protein
MYRLSARGFRALRYQKGGEGMARRVRRLWPRRRQIWLIAAACAIAVVAGAFATSLWQREGAQSSSVNGARILLVSPNEDFSPAVASSVQQLRAGGFTVIDDPTKASFAASAPGTVAFLVTRAAFADVPPTLWADLYSRHVIVGGLDVSLHELQPLARPGSTAGTARLQYTPTRPIFSFMYSAGGCARGAMSDWLENWNLSAIIQQRALEIANSTSLDRPDANCPADIAAGGIR